MQEHMTRTKIAEARTDKAHCLYWMLFAAIFGLIDARAGMWHEASDMVFLFTFCGFFAKFCQDNINALKRGEMLEGIEIDLDKGTVKWIKN